MENSLNLLEDKTFLAIIDEIAAQQNMSLVQAKAEVSKYLAELRSEHAPVFNTLAIEGAQYVLSRGYERTIDVNPQEIKELSKLMRRHSIAFVMTHKTYIDMFVLGVVLARHGLPLPYTFAGINMSFLGLGAFGRKTGAIFIRRSFKDNELYKATLRYFISSLVDQKADFMWAIEGTRSRTGKIVWPKMGILKYIKEAEQVARTDVKYIPVSIVYDLIPDVEDMIRESRGAQKAPESLKWFVNYVRKLGRDFGKISLRFGEPIEDIRQQSATVPNQDNHYYQETKPNISNFAFELVHKINTITPVTTTSLICTSLMSKFALTRKEMETSVLELMQLIEYHKPDALVDRGAPIGQSVQNSINLLLRTNILKQVGEGTHAKYSIVPERYLSANYYSNMGVHHLYHRAFIGLALIGVEHDAASDRLLRFWEEIMQLRDLFKFEFFYSIKPNFTDEIEADLDFLIPGWEEEFQKSGFSVDAIIDRQNILISQVVLNSYLEAYQVVAQSLLNCSDENPYVEDEFMEQCLFTGEEMHWQGLIHRVESVSKPFLLNGIRLAKNRNLIPEEDDLKTAAITKWLNELNELHGRIKRMQKASHRKKSSRSIIPLERNIVPGSRTASITNEINTAESGPHIGAFFDLDRTLIKGFSAKEFFQARLMSGQMTPKEIFAQINGASVYALGKKNFAALAAIGAQGVAGTKEQVFIEIGEEVYLNHLAKAIYPESRALVDAHLAKGHTVAIISAATPYQIRPVARDLGIQHIMSTEMEVDKGKFTGKIIDPPCWGQGKATAARRLSDRLSLDLSKSYFYTDSIEDAPLLEIVGHPRAVNPDNALATLAFQNDWPIYRFDDEAQAGLSGAIRTGLTMGSVIPAALLGAVTGARSFSWRDGVNNMTALVGDLGTRLAGIHIASKGTEHINNRPAVFIFNHQSNADMFIMAKLIRKDIVGIAKKELQYTPIGPFFRAAGIIFIDRKDKAKAIEAMKPAVDALRSGTSIGIAPEGTRSYDYKLGKFKKGAFHLAMQAQVPIIPIVIKNAHDVMPRGSGLIKPSVVEVVVLPPIFTRSWNKSNLDKNIAQIRKMYLKELGQEVMELAPA